MAETLAPYACDKCQSRKIACSRTQNGCQRCKDESVVCTYSRSGVIRRNRKRKHDALVSDEPSSPGTFEHKHTSIGTESNDLQSHLATDIAVTQERLRGLRDQQHGSLDALSSLSEASAAVWHDASDFDKSTSRFYLFGENAISWVDAFVHTLNRGRPLLSPAPPEVLDHLRASSPHKIKDRAWLIMYYSIILSTVSSTSPADKSTKAKLRSNLWLALNDARLLLEPSESNIQALTLLACHVEEFTTPSLCWMLVSNACRMLQALGVSHRRLDDRTRERRIMLFWHLNLVEKGLALIFGRPPTLHRAMAKEVSLPPISQLLPLQPHLPSPGASSSFGAHYMYQMFILSRVMGDIWICIYDDIEPDDESISVASESLKQWYEQAKQILEAAAMVEKPFLDASSADSLDLGLRTADYSYRYLRVLLARSSSNMRTQCLESSRKMLQLLDGMVSDSEEPYNGIIWQLICSPFTAFLTLFGEILSNAKDRSKEHRESLSAMEKLPVFLKNMSVRNTLASKLERIATVFVQHARSVVHPQNPNNSETEPNVGISIGAVPDIWSSTGNMLDWDLFFDHALVTPPASEPEVASQDTLPSGLETWTCDFFEGPVVDWLGLEGQG